MISISSASASTRARGRARWRRGGGKARVARAARDADDATGRDAVKEAFEKMYAPGTGKSIYFGVFQRDVRAEAGRETPSDDVRAARRARAREELVNIDDEERARRLDVGKVAGGVTLVMAIAQLALGASRIERAVIAIPLFFALGFVGSAKSGL